MLGADRKKTKSGLLTLGAAKDTLQCGATCALVVDAEPELLSVVTRALSRDGHTVSTAADLAHARAQAARGAELIVLDLHLPDGFGLELCRVLRSTNIDVPILVLTAQLPSPSGFKHSMPEPTTFSASPLPSPSFRREHVRWVDAARCLAAWSITGRCSARLCSSARVKGGRRHGHHGT